MINYEIEINKSIVSNGFVINSCNASWAYANQNNSKSTNILPCLFSTKSDELENW